MGESLGSGKLRCALVALLTLGHLFPAIVAAGALDPPGAPGPTPATLEEIEDALQALSGPGLGTPIVELPTTISEPGLHFLASSLTGVAGLNGIVINADDVTLDLNGHTLIGVEGSVDGIVLGGAFENIAVRNGTVRGWGDDGVNLAEATGVQVEHLRVFGNGGDGLRTGPGGGVVRACTARDNGGAGFEIDDATLIVGCTSQRNGEGFTVFGNSQAVECVAGLNLGEGFSVSAGATLLRCRSDLNTGDGFVLDGDCEAIDCNAQGNGGDGLRATDRCNLIGNVADANGTAGLRTTGTGNTVENNTLRRNGVGLQIMAGGDLVRGNIAAENGDNHLVEVEDIATPNVMETLISDLPEEIDWPGAVRVTGTLLASGEGPALTLESDGITLDLAGHSLIGTNGYQTAVAVSAESVAVHGGTITGFDGPVILLTAKAVGTHLHDLRLIRNSGPGIFDEGAGAGLMERVLVSLSAGVDGDGITVGEGWLLVDCVAFQNGGHGFSSGPSTALVRCVSTFNDRVGLLAPFDANLIAESVANSNGETGIIAGNATLVRDSVAQANTGQGIGAGSNNLIHGNTTIANTLNSSDGSGISIGGDQNFVHGNLSNSNQVGITVGAAGDDNHVVANRVGLNSLFNFVVFSAANNHVALQVEDPDAAGPWANLVNLAP